MSACVVQPVRCVAWRGVCAHTYRARAATRTHGQAPHPTRPTCRPTMACHCAGRLASVADRAGARAPRACATGSGARKRSTRCVCSACVRAHHRSAATTARVSTQSSPQAGALRQPTVWGVMCHSSLCHGGVRVRACVRVCAPSSAAPRGMAPPPCHPTCHTPHATHRMPHTAGGLAWLTVQVLVPHVRVPPPARRASCRLAACAALAYRAVHTTALQPLQPVSQRSLRHKLVRCVNRLCVGSGAPRRRVRAACARAWGGVRA